MSYVVYRCFDADERLLYIGCTSDLAARMGVHRADRRNKASRWLQVSMARVDVLGTYPTLAGALGAEDQAIATQQPLFNRQGRRAPMSMILPAVADYLIARGHHALAAETACTCWSETREDGDTDPWCRAHVVVELANSA